MKKRVFLPFLTILVAMVFYSATVLPESQTRTIVNNMIKAIDSYHTCTYTMRSEERIVNMKDLRGGDIFTKLSISPRKTYMKMMTDPNKGTEILYVDGERSNKALVNPGKWLPTVTLNPLSSLLTKEQHHTITSAGFNMVSGIVGAGIKKADAAGKFDEVFKYVGDVTWNGRNCYKLVIEDPTYGYTTYTAAKGDNMQSVALKLHIPEYSLVELDGVKNFEEGLSGETLKVPTSYARKTVFYIDKENNLPIFQEISDDKGVFERYQFFNVVFNPAYKSDEFTRGFDGYKF